jgi:hypothetical protein
MKISLAAEAPGTFIRYEFTFKGGESTKRSNADYDFGVGIRVFVSFIQTTVSDLGKVGTV